MNFEIPNPLGNVTDLNKSFDFNALDLVPQANTRSKTISALYICITVVGLIMNFALLFTLFRGGRKGLLFRAPSTILIINLAVADSLLLLTLPFSASQHLEMFWNFGDVFCKVIESSKFLNYYASVFFLTAMAGDRYFSIFRSTTYGRVRAVNKLAIVSVCVWLVAILANVPVIYFSGVNNFGHCSIVFPGSEVNLGGEHSGNHDGSDNSILPSLEIKDFIVFPENSTESENDILLSLSNFFMPVEEVQEPTKETNNHLLKNFDDILKFTLEDEYHCSHAELPSVVIWLTSNFVIGFVLPFIIIFLCYFRIILLKSKASPSKNENSMELSSDQSSTTSSATDSSYTKTSSNFIVCNRRTKRSLDILFPCLILAFLICWLPYHAWHLAKLNGIAITVETCDWIRDITFVLAYSNSALNPILNFFFLFNFKTRIGESSNWLRKLSYLTSTRSSSETQFRKDTDDTGKSVMNVTVVTEAAQEPNESEKKAKYVDHTAVEME